LTGAGLFRSAVDPKLFCRNIRSLSDPWRIADHPNGFVTDLDGTNHGTDGA
jgi:hypothetical protein